MSTQKTPEHIAILVDGGNFHHLVLKKLELSEDRFDFDAYASFLSNGRQIASKTDYTGTVRSTPGDQRSLAAMARQTAFLTRLSKGKWCVETSKLRRRDEVLPIDNRVVGYKKLRLLGLREIEYSRDREKGIDVKIAVDLLMGAVDDRYDTAVLISSDRDLLPAVNCVRKKFGKRVEYIGFSLPDSRAPNDPKKASSPTIALLKNTDTQRVMGAPDFSAFIVPKPAP